VNHRILPAFLIVALVASSGVGGGLLHLCQANSSFWIGCCCPHDDDPDPCTVIENGCCELRSLPAVSSSGPAVSEVGKSGFSALPVRPLDADLISGAGSDPVTRFADWSAPPRAGPPLFLEHCSYLS
jgi:hypothetical protein